MVASFSYPDRPDRVGPLVVKNPSVSVRSLTQTFLHKTLLRLQNKKISRPSQTLSSPSRFNRSSPRTLYAPVFFSRLTLKESGIRGGIGIWVRSLHFRTEHWKLGFAAYG